MGKWWRNRDRIRVSGNEALVVELERIRDEDDRQNKRIAVIEEDTKAIHKLTASIEKLVIQMQDMLSEQKEQGERIRRLEEEPGNAWNEVKKKAIDTVVSGIMTLRVRFARTRMYIIQQRIHGTNLERKSAGEQQHRLQISCTGCVRAGKMQQASWERLKSWKTQRKSAKRGIQSTTGTAKRYIRKRAKASRILGTYKKKKSGTFSRKKG